MSEAIIVQEVYKKFGKPQKWLNRVSLFQREKANGKEDPGKTSSLNGDHKPMEEMSRGMQQKVAIARALLSQPKILLLDEPTTGLDLRSKREVQAVIRELNQEYGTTILLTTHDMLEADTLCERVAIIDGGKIVALDTPQALKGAIPRNGHEPTLEDVFMELTGKQLVKEADV